LGVRLPPGSPRQPSSARNCSFLYCENEIRYGASVPAGIKSPAPSVWFAPLKRIFHFRTSSSSQLGPLEERLLAALWKRGDATVRELVEDDCHDLAYTTIMTTLDRLFKKQVLNREAEGRAFRYTPRFSREELHQEAAREAFRQLLDSSPGASLPLSYLVEVLTERDAGLLEDLRQLVEAKRRSIRTGGNQPKNKENE
jgi:predicted transcriptional regulator